VFVNLLVNAAHALDPAKASENVVAIATRADADTVTISISDTGSGISPADLERVFVPFFTTKPAGLGTGLGLPISRDIVESLGGTLTLASAPGAGTTATIVLRRQADAPADRPSEGKKRRRLLLVDDDDAVLGSTAELLATTYDVTTATSTGRAKELLEASTYDAVVCDVTMGGTSGPELAAWSKARGIDAPFVLMSGQGPTSARDAKRVHAVFLEKPFLEGVLVDAVERAMRGGKIDKP
jgi:CheY-like chemotaxis protein/anti-sigma regulatory factor (Ser/Thr protein kinase)